MGLDADVIIVGGGMVGSTLAALLGGANYRVIVLEESATTPAPSEASPPELRVSSVNRGSAEVFDRAGGWQRILGHRVCPFRRLRVWDSLGIEANFDASEAGYDCLGWFIENSIIVASVHESLASMASVEWRAPVQAQSISLGAEAASVTLADGGELRGKLVVGADGPNSTVRHLSGIDSHETDYEQRALVTNVRTTLPQQDVTWQRFTPHGPQAFLPLAGPNASLIWYDTPERVRDREALSDADLRAAILAAFPPELGDIEAIHARASFPIHRRHAKSYRHQRLALVGDAAHVIHPLMGQGLNLGIQGVATLAGAITNARDDDPGNTRALAAYEYQHRRRALAMMAATDACHRLFTTESTALPLLGAGLLGLARLAPIGRGQAMRYAMGLPVSDR
jgi:2-octaprenyl-3-methyl-6-methoxy-1,4-benzoquinol hydroxylase